MKSTCVRGMIPSGQEGREAEGSAALRLGAASAMVRFPKGRGLVCGGDGTRAGFREEDKVELHEAEGNVQTDLPARLTALVVSGERLVRCSCQGKLLRKLSGHQPRRDITMPIIIVVKEGAPNVGFLLAATSAAAR